jgi:heme exporter protein B
MRAPSFRAAFTAILAKDLRIELRTLQSLPGMAIFATTTFVLFHFALDRSSLSGGLAAGVLWATLLFAAILGVTRLFVAEREQAGFDAILLSPVDRTALLAAKAVALFVYLCLLDVVAIPVFAAFFLEDGSGLGPLIAVALLANLGVASTGTLVSAIAVNSRARDVLVPLLLLPLLMPVVIAAAGATKGLLAAGAPVYDRFGTWLAVLGLYDLVFALLAYAVFDFVVED